MPAKVILGLACLLIAPLTSRAHQDPSGEIHPNVEVEDGKFVIYFHSRVGDGDAAWRLVFTPDGKTVLPRHRVTDELRRMRDEQRRSTGLAHVEARRGVNEGKFRFVLKHGKDGLGIEQPLPVEPAENAMVDKTTFLSDRVGFTWSVARVDPKQVVKLMFSIVETKGFSPALTVMIGEPATIYDFPSASNPVWAARRWWVAWVRLAETEAERKDDLRSWQTMLTSIDPTTGRLEHKRVPGASNWNTGVSMKTTGGWLCLAWHASVDGDYPGTAKIVTAFEKLPER